MPKLSTHKDQVEDILKRSKKSRDNNVLMYYLLLKEFYAINLDDVSASSLLLAAHKRQLPNYDSITRVSRRLQELNPELRGKEWNARRGLEEETIEDLRNNF